ncbi:MAG TPA: hypothetical protein VMK32_07120 [Burkholderiaceae bacterium]|nr:hypothetical protein [Burkholderiaceae bacterium]
MFCNRFLAATLIALSAATAASGGEIEAAYDAGHYAEALSLLETRGLEGDIEAQGMAGMMHLMGSSLYGSEVTTDPERAARWLRASAMNGSIQAQFILAQLYMQGLGVPQDSNRAAWWLAQATTPFIEFSIAQASEL